MTFYSLVGTTASGKTGFAMKLAQDAIDQDKYSVVDIISADSRQVYKGMEIVSGADIPENLPAGVKLHGLAMIRPDEEWSLAHFQKLVLPILEKAKLENRLVLVVGGTGLYHENILNPEVEINVGPDEELRAKAEKMELSELQSLAKKANPQRFNQLNHSDVHNPRRLIRLIELANSDQQVDADKFQDYTQKYLGLKAYPNELEEKIRARVEDRFKNGAIAEVQLLMEQYSGWSLPAFTATGVQEIRQYLEKKITEEECLERWTTAEVQYAKRQLTWWKNKKVSWFDQESPDWQEEAISFILNS